MSLISQEELERVTTYSRPSDIKKWLDRHGVKYWSAKNGVIVTTTEAINASLLESEDDGGIEFA